MAQWIKFLLFLDPKYTRKSHTYKYIHDHYSQNRGICNSYSQNRDIRNSIWVVKTGKSLGLSSLPIYFKIDKVQSNTSSQ